MWGSLAPARRRLYLGVVALVLVLALVVVVVLLRRGSSVSPVAQDDPGPVLLVPGYGGSTASLEVLASALTAAGKQTEVVAPRGSGTQDLRSQAADLSSAVDRVLASSGAASVDLVGYSAGGVVVRYYIALLGGDSKVRRAITLSSPHHGTSLAALAGSLGSQACPTACQQLDPDSTLLAGLNSGDETPPGPSWVALWTTDDKTVVPPTSGSLEGAVDFSVQSVCPGLVVSHSDVPRTPAVIAMVLSELSASAPAVPRSSVCSA